MFAKHIKIEEQIEILGSEVMRIVVGTPSRLQKLHESTGAAPFVLFDSIDVLDMMADCEFIMIDLNKDAKQRTIMTIPEVTKDLYEFIYKTSLKKLQRGKTRIIMY